MAEDIKKINEIFLLGDSLSDNGNFFSGAIYDTGAAPTWLKVIHPRLEIESPPSSTGLEFTDAKTAGAGIVEDIELHEDIKLHVVPAYVYANGNNYSVANATIADYREDGIVSTHIEEHPDGTNKISVASQALKLMNDHKMNGIKNSVFIIFAGGNDIMNTAKSAFTKHEKQDNIRMASHVLFEIIKRIDHTFSHLGNSFVIIGPPDIGIIPAFYNTAHQSIATELSELMDAYIEQHVKNEMSHLLYVSIIDDFRSALAHWPSITRHAACVSDIADGHFGYLKLIFKGVFSTDYLPGCNYEKLSNGAYPFFDYFHSSHALNNRMKNNIVSKIESFLHQE